MEPCVWWVSQFDCLRIGAELDESIPFYLRQQYESLVGRSGRGRLWCSLEVFGEDVSVGFPVDATPISRYAESSGGIVIKRDDIVHLRELPGVVTDLNLKRI